MRVARALHADQIALFSAKTEPWPRDVVDAITTQIAQATWDNGRKPRVRLVTGLRFSDQITDVMRRASTGTQIDGADSGSGARPPPVTLGSVGTRIPDVVAVSPSQSESFGSPAWSGRDLMLPRSPKYCWDCGSRRSGKNRKSQARTERHSSPRPPLRISHPQSTLPQPCMHRPSVHTEPRPDGFQRCALDGQPNGLVDLRRGETAHAHRHPSCRCLLTLFRLTPYRAANS